MSYNSFMLKRLAPGCYFGEKVKETKTVGLTLSECLYPPEGRFTRHTHEHAYLCLVLRGSYVETTGSGDSECAPASLILHPENEWHANRFHDDGGNIFNVEIGPEWAERIRTHSSVLSRRIEVSSGTPVALMRRLYQEFRRFDGVSPLAIEGLMLELLAAMTRESFATHESYIPRWLERIRESLRDRYLAPGTLAEIAAANGVHPTHLARAFRRHYHCTVGEYIRQLRIEATCQQLTLSDRPLSEIAQVAGFADQSHFSRQFKRSLGVTPKVYRERAR